MKYIVLCSTLVSLVACGGQTGDTSSSSSSSSSSNSSSSNSSSASSSSSSTSSSSNSGSGGFSSSSSGGGSLPPAELTGAVWEVRYVENEIGIRRASNIPMTLRFDDNRLAEGTTACGAFTAEYWYRLDALGFSDAPRIPLDCAPKPSSLFEKDYYSALNKVKRYAVTESKLILQTNDNATIVYEPVGIKCEMPKYIEGEASPNLVPPWKPVNVVLTTSGPLDQLLHRLQADYPDLEELNIDACSSNQVAVSVNRITLQYLRCRSDINAISYQ